MADLVVVDSSFFIRAARARSDPFALLDDASSRCEFAITGIVWVEVVRGRILPRQRLHYETRFATMRFLNPTPRTWQHAAGLAGDIERSGFTVPTTDLTIATCALEHGAAVLTFDRHFQHVPGLVVLDSLP